jgi:type IV secretory pathway VirB2 component (pilin)
MSSSLLTTPTSNFIDGTVVAFFFVELDFVFERKGWMWVIFLVFFVVGYFGCAKILDVKILDMQNF